MSFFPQSTKTSNGASFPQQNRKLGLFTGKFKDLRPITSNTSKTVFAVIEIEVPGETDLFQDYLNFNPVKEEKSIGFLVAHCKAALRATGEAVNEDEEHDMAWVEATYNSLKGKTVKFQQTQNANGQLSINYIA